MALSHRPAEFQEQHATRIMGTIIFFGYVHPLLVRLPRFRYASTGWLIPESL
jgi:hypothetical protein